MQQILPATLSSESMGLGIPDATIPDTAIPPNIRTLLYAFQQKTSAPIPTILSCVLATLAVAQGGSVDIESWKGGRFPLNFFALVASGTGEGKTSVIDAIMRPLSEFDSEIDRQQLINTNNYDAKYIRWKTTLKVLEKEMKEAIKSNSPDVGSLEGIIESHLSEKPTRSNSTKKIISDVTLTGLRDALVEADGDSLLMLNSDSARVFKETLLKFGPEFCSAWSGESFRIVKNRVSIFSANPRLSMLLMVQPSMLEGYFDDDHEFRTSGLAARFITYFPDSLVGQKSSIPMNASEYYIITIDGWYKSIRNLLNSNRLRHISCGNSEKELMKMSEESVRFLKSAFDKIDRHLAGDNNDFSGIEDIAHRMLEQSCKIAALYELFDDPNSREIKPHHIEMAFNLVLAHASSFKRICDPDKPKVSTLKKASKIINFLRCSQKYYYQLYDSYGNWFYAIPMDTYQRVGPIRKKTEYEEAFRLLEMSGIIRIDSAYIPIGMRNVNKKVIYLLNLQAPIQLLN